jgi:hypothetical protein
VSEKTRSGGDGGANRRSDEELVARLAQITRPAAPEGFADRVMNSLANSPAAPDRPGLLARVGAFLFPFAGPRLPQLTGALALAAFALLIAAIASQPVRNTAGTSAPDHAGQPSIETNAADYVLHEFELVAPGADKVCLVGDFNEWKLCEAPLLKNEETGAWTVRIAVPRGRHEYMFVVDDAAWVTDPEAAVRVDDGFGNLNAVVFL